MQLPPIDHEEALQSWLDGDMSPDERAAFARAMAEDDALRAEAHETQALVGLLGTLPRYEVPRSFALTSEMVRAAGAPTPGVVRLLPIVRALAVAALLAFVVVGAFTGYQLVTDADETRVTDRAPGASEETTGDDGIVTGIGESAASGAVKPEQPANGQDTPSDTSVSRVASTGSDAGEDTIWLVSSAGLGVLALVSGGYWLYLVRTGSPRSHPA